MIGLEGVLEVGSVIAAVKLLIVEPLQRGIGQESVQKVLIMVHHADVSEGHFKKAAQHNTPKRLIAWQYEIEWVGD